MSSSLWLVLCVGILVAIAAQTPCLAAEAEAVAVRRLTDAALRLNELRGRFAGPQALLPAEAFTAEDPGRFSDLGPGFEKAHPSAATRTFAQDQRARLGRYVVAELDRQGAALNRALQAGIFYKEADPFAAVERALGPLQVYVDSWIAFGGYSTAFGGDPFVVYVLDPTCSYAILPGGPWGHNEEPTHYRWGSPDVGLANPQILPRAWPIPAVPSRRLEGFGCRDQYVPLSFAVQAGEALTKVELKATPLTCTEAAIPAAAVDLRVVKAWWHPYMGTSADDKDGQNAFINEMLLHDEGFVTATAEEEQVNRFKDAERPNDLPELTPVSIAAGESRQFWVTVHVPADAKQGKYSGKIEARSESGHTFAVDLAIEVLPFQLEPTPFAYTTYYRCSLGDEGALGDKGIDPRLKTRQQMQREFVDMAEHGLNTLITYDGVPAQTAQGWDFSRLGAILEMASQAGLTRSPFVWLGHGQWLAPAPEGREGPKTMADVAATLTDLVTSVNAFCDARGYPRPALYGEDEVSGDRLVRLRHSYRAVAQAGGLVAQACYGSFFEEIGDALGLPIVFQGAMTAENEKSIRAAQAAGHECWIYNTPATDMANSPAVFRRRYGLALWRNGENGAAPWAYSDFQEGKDLQVYQEHPHGRMYAFVLPTLDGDPINTVIYEAFREGIYDTRYLATLERHLRTARDRGTSQERVRQVDEWLASLSVNDDLRSVRRQMVDFTLALMAEDPGTASPQGAATDSATLPRRASP